MARPSQNILSTRAIARAALALVEKNGDFTIPGIAAVLSVNPSSLYHHLPGGRSAIISRMREEVYDRIALDPLVDATIPALDRLRSWMRHVRIALASSPAAVNVLVAAPVQDSRTLDIYEALFVILRDAGIPVEDRVVFSSMIDTVVLGSALDAGSPSPLWCPRNEFVPEIRLAAHHGDDTNRALKAFDLAIEAVIGAVIATTSASVSPGSSLGHAPS